MSVFLSVRNLSVRLRNTRERLLRSVDIDVPAGAVCGLVGESGAGKSMIGKAVLGVLPRAAEVVEGEIFLDGEDLLAMSPDRRRKAIGAKAALIPQDPMTALNPSRKIGPQITDRLVDILGWPKAGAFSRAQEVLSEVRIPEPERVMRLYPHELSGGMRQRVLIASAFAAEPKLIVADEPTTALDVSIQAQVIALLKTLAREKGTSMMLVTHDMGVIAETADRVAVMYAGRIAEIGAVRNVVKHPSHPYTIGLMGSIPPVSRRLERMQQIDGAMPRLSAIPQGCAYNPRCPRVFDRCRVERPDLLPAGETRAACWLYDAASQPVARAHA